MIIFVLVIKVKFWHSVTQYACTIQIMYNIYFENHECHPIYGWLSFTVLIYFDLLLGAHSMKTHSKQQTPFTFHSCSQLWIHTTSETNWKKAHPNIESCCGIGINQCGGGYLILVISIGFGYLKTSKSKNYLSPGIGERKIQSQRSASSGYFKKSFKEPTCFHKRPHQRLGSFWAVIWVLFENHGYM